jgi:hypothetical protein
MKLRVYVGINFEESFRRRTQSQRSGGERQVNEARFCRRQTKKKER